MLAEFVAHVQKRGLLPGVDPLRAAQHLTWLCMSGHYEMLLTGVIAEVSPVQVAADIDAALATFLRAYGRAG